MREPVTIDEGRQNRLRKEEELAAKQSVTDLDAVLGTPEGRRVLYRVLELCGCGVVNTDPQRFDNFKRLDDYAMAVAVGEQLVGNSLMSDWLTLSPGLFRTMLDEAAKKIAEGIARSRHEAAQEDTARKAEVAEEGEDDETG